MELGGFVPPTYGCDNERNTQQGSLHVTKRRPEQEERHSTVRTRAPGSSQVDGWRRGRSETIAHAAIA